VDQRAAELWRMLAHLGRTPDTRHCRQLRFACERLLGFRKYSMRLDYRASELEIDQIVAEDLTIPGNGPDYG